MLTDCSFESVSSSDFTTSAGRLVTRLIRSLSDVGETRDPDGELMTEGEEVKTGLRVDRDCPPYISDDVCEPRLYNCDTAPSCDDATSPTLVDLGDHKTFAGTGDPRTADEGILGTMLVVAVAARGLANELTYVGKLGCSISGLGYTATT